MKLSKFVKRAKSESYCVVIHADDSGIWLGTRLALYNATELPYMEGKEQAGAVLDIDSKAWEKMFFDEKYTAHAGADFGMNLTETDPTEQEARRVPLEMFYKGMGLVGVVYGSGGELIFYDAALIAPIADVVKTSDYIQTVVRKTAGGAPYVVIKDGFEVLAGFAPLKIITKQFLEDLSEFESACVSQYMREQKQALDAADPDKQDEGAAQIGELALIPNDSPISNLGILFYNTLFDENASCHIALGLGFPNVIKDYDKYTLDEIHDKGVNDSVIHVDFMVGDATMNIDGITPDGKVIPVFRNGNWTEKFM